MTSTATNTTALTGPSLVTEQQILRGMVSDETFLRTVLPHLKEEYFSEDATRRVFSLTKDYVLQYNAPPSKEALLIAVDQLEGLRQPVVDSMIASIDAMYAASGPIQREWLIRTAEKYCQDRAVYNALLESISILDDKKGKKSKGSIPEMLTQALSVSFDTNVGHDYIESADDRFKHYHRVEERVPFDIDVLNEATKGGLPKKTISVIQAGCVTPDSIVTVRIDGREPIEVPLGSIEAMLANGWEVRIASPAGWSLVEEFVHKGSFVEYAVFDATTNEHIVSVNEDHLFACRGEWVRAADLCRFIDVPLMSECGERVCVVVRGSREVPIVDIRVGVDSIPYTDAEGN